jgi:CoA:oxalate CoA-transferase
VVTDSQQAEQRPGARGPLVGLRVLDLTWVLSGPYCTMTLGDLGADVVKVERPPYGDVARTTGPLIGGESAYFHSVNRGKRSISIDLKSEEGKALFLRLIPHVDVLVENYTPGVMAGLGLDYDVLSKVNERLVYCSISGFGQTGPMRSQPALDIVVQGAGGIMSITGEPGGRPARAGISLGDIAAGMYAAIGILAALHERERSGRGQYIDISMLDSQIAIQENAFLRHHLGESVGPLGTRHPSSVPFQAFPTSDGYIVVALAWGVPNQWHLFCAELGLVEIADDERFFSAQARARNVDALEPILEAAFRQSTTADWVERLQRYNIPCGPLNTIAQAAALPQLAERGMFVPIEHRTIGTLPLVNTPVKLSRTPGGISQSSPDMGAHTREVLRDLLALDEAALDALFARGVLLDERPEVDLG